MGVQEHYVSGARVAASAGWTAALLLWGLAWLVLLLEPDYWRIWGMVAVTAVMATVAAAVLQVRFYMVKVCGLIRRTSAVVGEPDKVRAIH